MVSNSVVGYMASEDPRKKNRRQAERRAKERRVIEHSFGSPEWISAIKENYLLWPKIDRRGQDRRNESRRQGSRRIHSLARPIENSKKMYDLLTAEEKQMLNELAQSDD